MSDSTGAPDREREFTALFEREYGDVLRFIQRRSTPGQEEDAAAETFLVAWRRFSDMPEQPGANRAWLFGIARHVLLNQRRAAQRRGALEVRLARHVDVSQCVSADHLLLLVDIERAWPRLTAAHQEALALTIFEGLESAAAAEVLGISPVAYRLRLSRARRALRLHLDHSASTAPAATHERTLSS